LLDDAGLTARRIAARAWGTPIQVISRSVEHSSIAVTKLVHRDESGPIRGVSDGA
jgi:hypothetical protein